VTETTIPSGGRAACARCGASHAASDLCPRGLLRLGLRSSLSAGDRLGPYEIVAPIGAGGMGDVYRARDERLKRDVAVKVLPASVADDPDRLRRFEKEAQAASALNHPNIMAVYDVGAEDGRPYIVTELLDGQTLRERLAGGPLGARKTIEYAGQIARGLAAAHGKGIVHRDLKPENVFVTRDEQVKILDFGVAKLGPDAAAQAASPTAPPTPQRSTEPGTVLGTVAYMSPEQVLGEAADSRSDIFSFGTVVYEMLTGQHPFQRSAAAETMAAILKKEPAAPSAVAAGTPPGLDAVVLHCLEKSPAARFQSASDIAFQLTTGSAPSVTGIAESLPPKRGKAIVAVVAVMLAALGTLWYARHRGGRTAAVRRVAVLPFENLGAAEDDYFTDGMSDEVRSKLTGLRGVEVIARASSTPYKKTTKPPMEIAKELSVGYLLTATVRWQKSADGTSRVHVTPELVEVRTEGAPASKWEQTFDASLTDVFRVQADIAEKVAREMGAALGAADARRLAATPTRSLEAYDAFLKGQESWGQGRGNRPASLRRELAFYERAVALDPGFAEAWASLSQTIALLHDYEPGEFDMDKARAAAERAIVLAPHEAIGYRSLGTYYRFRFENDRALEQYLKAQAIAPSESLDADIGLTMKQMGRWEEAVAHLRRAESTDPLSLNLRRFLAAILFDMRRYAEAREAVERGLAIAPGDADLVFAKCMTFLGEGNLAAARAAAEETPNFGRFANDAPIWMFDQKQRDRLFRLTPEAFDDDRGSWAVAFAQAYWTQGDLVNARRYAEEARKEFEERLAKAPDDEFRRVWLGVALALLGQKEAAIREGKRAVELVPLTHEAEGAAYNRELLARIYALLGEPDAALDLLEQLLAIPSDYSPGWLRIDPNFDSLRGNPRFQKLVAGK
jgi:TolB-like protein/Flp pilus assembly protein TadD